MGAFPAARSGGWNILTLVLNSMQALEMLQAAKQVNGLQHAGVQVDFSLFAAAFYDVVFSGITRNI